MKILVALAVFSLAACGGEAYDLAESEAEVIGGPGTPAPQSCTNLPAHPPPRADLIVEEVYSAPSHEGGFVLVVVVRNQGCGAAPSTSPIFTVTGSTMIVISPIIYTDVDEDLWTPNGRSLAAQSSREYRLRVSSLMNTYEITLDPNDQVDETNEANNTEIFHP